MSLYVLVYLNFVMTSIILGIMLISMFIRDEDFDE